MGEVADNRTFLALRVNFGEIWRTRMEFGSDTILKVRYFRSLVMFASTVVIHLHCLFHRVTASDHHLRSSVASAAGVTNLLCAPELRASCEREAREAEMNFSKSLTKALQTSSECAIVQFLVPSGCDKTSKELEIGFVV